MPTILPRVLFLYPNNTQVLNVVGLADVTTGSFLNSALVTAILFDQRGVPDTVLNGIVFGYLPASNGNYQGTVPASFSPPAFEGKTLGGYSLQITADQAGVQAVFTIPVILSVRSQQ